MFSNSLKAWCELPRKLVFILTKEKDTRIYLAIRLATAHKESSRRIQQSKASAVILEVIRRCLIRESRKCSVWHGWQAQNGEDWEYKEAGDQSVHENARKTSKVRISATFAVRCSAS